MKQLKLAVVGAGHIGRIHARLAGQLENVDLVGENCEIEVLLHNEKPVGAELPNFVVLEVSETDPVSKGGRLKPATLETGAEVQVPSFIERGDRVKIDTRDRKYVERA